MKLRVAWILLLAISVASCASYQQGEPTSEAQYTLLEVSNHYLMAISRGDAKQVDPMVAWDVYGENNSNKVTREQVLREVLEVPALWKPGTSPILNLRPLKITGSGDHTEVILVKGTDPDSPQIRIRFGWSGGGWLVEDDSLFGPGAIITTSLAKSKGLKQ